MQAGACYRFSNRLARKQEEERNIGKSRFERVQVAARSIGRVELLGVFSGA